MAKGITLATALAASILVLVVGVAGLGGWSFELLVPYILPVGGGLALGMDRLSAFFLLIIAAGVFPSAVYALGYGRGRGNFCALSFIVFVGAMAMVVLARNILTFLLSWEAMSLASYFLVMTESDRDDTR